MGAVVAAAWLVVLSSAAGAGDARGNIYVEGRGGVVYLPAAELVDTTGELAELGISEIRAELDTGFVVEGAAGYVYEEVLRGEVALGYRRNTLDGLSATSPGGPVTTEVDGEVSTFTALANIYYDVPLGAPLVPFVGGGAGLAAVVFELDGANDADVVFAWQLVGGLAVELSEHLAISARYVYLETTDPAFEGVEANYASHSVLLGVRYRF